MGKASGRFWGRLIGAGSVAATVIVLAVGVMSVSFESNAVRVDDRDVVTEACCGRTEATQTLPTLRVAIAAMISPETTKEYYGDLMRLIGRKLERRTVFLQRKTYAEVNSLLEAKEVDLAFVCAGPYVAGHEKFGMEILAAPVVDGQSLYRSVVVVRRDSGIKTFDDLKGKRFAFTDPDSNTGSLVPRYFLAQRGLTPEQFFGETFFTNGHDNSIKAVVVGLADGAAVDSLVWTFMRREDPKVEAVTRAVYSSPPYGIPPVVVHPDLNAELKGHLREILLALDRDPEAAPLMEKLRIQRFAPGSDGAYDSVREMRKWVLSRSDTTE